MNQPLHVRRCHVCGKVTESCDDIAKCLFCGKSLLPFYYFDKRKIIDYADNEVRPNDPKPDPIRDTRFTPGQTEGFGPIRGLTAYW
jgi:hypothetical protein